jgi:hypothetical protein
VGWRLREHSVGYIENPQRLGSHLGSQRRLRCGVVCFAFSSSSFHFVFYPWMRLMLWIFRDDVGAVLGNIAARISSLEDSLTGACVGLKMASMTIDGLIYKQVWKRFWFPTVHILIHTHHPFISNFYAAHIRQYVVPSTHET